MSESRSPASDVDAESWAILDLVRDLCRQLELSYDPQRVVWSEYEFDWRGKLTIFKMPVDSVAVLPEKIVLAKKAKGVLAQEEWGPVILPGLIAKKRWPNANRNMFRIIFSCLFSLLVLGTIGLSLLFPQETLIRGRNYQPIGYVSLAGFSYFLAGIFAYMILGYRLFHRYTKKIMRKSNRETIHLIGRDPYLNTFRKLENYLQTVPAREEGRDEDLARVRERVREAEQFQTFQSSPEE